MFFMSKSTNYKHHQKNIVINSKQEKCPLSKHYIIIFISLNYCCWHVNKHEGIKQLQRELIIPAYAVLCICHKTCFVMSCAINVGGQIFYKWICSIWKLYCTILGKLYLCYFTIYCAIIWNNPSHFFFY